MPLNFDGQRAAPLEDFEDSIRDLGLDALNQLGRELAAEHREATNARDWESAGDLYARRGILWERIKELDPPLCEISYPPDASPEVVFFRTPTDEEKADLREKLGEYEIVEELLAVF